MHPRRTQIKRVCACTSIPGGRTHARKHAHAGRRTRAHVPALRANPRLSLSALLPAPHSAGQRGQAAAAAAEPMRDPLSNAPIDSQGQLVPLPKGSTTPSPGKCRLAAAAAAAAAAATAVPPGCLPPGWCRPFRSACHALCPARSGASGVLCRASHSRVGVCGVCVCMSRREQRQRACRGVCHRGPSHGSSRVRNHHYHAQWQGG